MATKAKHAFGMLENIDAAISSGKIDAYDIIFAKDANGKPYVGWVDKDGNKVICDDSAELAELEKQLEAKANAEEVKAEIAKKVDAVEVEEKINTAVTDTVASAKAYTDGKVESAVEAAMSEHLVKRYEVADVPAGTLVDYFDKEIRIMCPADAEFAKQSVGVGGNSNNYYMTFRTYAPNDDVVGYIEHLGDQADPEVLTDLKTDKYGRKYQPTWLSLAGYDESTDTWTYYGATSSTEKYIGWDYQIDWYDADGVMVKSDVVRINLSNEECHNAIEPYYMGSMRKEVDTKIEEKIEEKIAEVEGAIEIVEF